MASRLAAAGDENLTAQGSQRPQLDGAAGELADGVVELDLRAGGVGVAHVPAQRLQVDEGVVDVRNQRVALVQDDPRPRRRRVERLAQVDVALHVEVPRRKIGPHGSSRTAHWCEKKTPVEAEPLSGPKRRQLARVDREAHGRRVVARGVWQHRRAAAVRVVPLPRAQRGVELRVRNVTALQPPILVVAAAARDGRRCLAAAL
mmetsp:Transcript_20545/g.60791  ORF Transcript_20545/g.60791 Transcript_20545/m.60791 type:complete len:203 (-) Transcript_20545:63-671(-)